MRHIATRASNIPNLPMCAPADGCAFDSHPLKCACNMLKVERVKQVEEMRGETEQGGHRYGYPFSVQDIYSKLSRQKAVRR